MSNFDSIQIDKIGFLDIGNSSIKLGLRKEEHWEIKIFTKADELTSALFGHEINFLVVCNVRPSTDWLEDLSSYFSIAVLETVDIPKNRLIYDTPDTLGMDRYLVCLGGWRIYKEPVLVIDTGSACTIDYMSAEGVFYGGVIMPGVQTLLGVFHKSAPALPTFNFSIPKNFPGKSSHNSLQWGLSQLYLDGIHANIERFQHKMGTFKVLLTGGDASLLSDHLNIVHELRPDLMFIGMEDFLEG